MRRAFVFTLFCSLLYPALALASCGSASCPIDTRSSFVTSKGAIRLGYEFEFVDQNQPRISTHKANVGEISGHHDEQRTINRIHRLTGSFGLTDRLSLDLGLPVISRSHRHIHNHHGTPIPQGWDFTGLGDLSVQTRYAFYKPEDNHRPTLSAIGGAEFPTGKDEVENDSGDHAEPGIMPGSGSYDGVIGLASLQHFSVPTLRGEFALLPLFASFTFKYNGEGHDDYRLGNQWSANVGTTYPLSSWLGIMGQLNYLAKGHDNAGLTHEEVEKTGGEYVYVSPGIQFRLGSAWDWSSIVQIPVHQRVNEIQLTSDYNVITSLRYTFWL
jgi:hypothetical protein